MLVKSWGLLFKKNDAYLEKGVWHNPKSSKEAEVVRIPPKVADRLKEHIRNNIFL